ncbi:response regulator transcription factor [Actinoallomurus vinaceus]|uniref:Response regulator transcription factor n=1 Tax=Actinoallomurus vinaceus TaxID=1080074 RepID=A0ABP8UUE5_9ACTN
MLHIAVLDDHPVARHGLKSMLAALPDCDVAVSVASLDEARAALGDDPRIGLLVADLYLDGGRPSISAISEFAERLPVLVMSASARRADVIGAIRAGAAGYLTKSSSPELFRSAVMTVAAGGFFLAAELADLLQAELAASAATIEAVPRLSDREEETLSYIARGFTHAQIATRMHVRKSTIDTYVERIRTKLQVGNKADLTRAALRRADAAEPRPDTQ